MATTWKAPTWRMPNEKNQSKFENYGLTFDGNTEYINCGNVEQLKNASVITWNCWINFASANFNFINEVLFANSIFSLPLDTFDAISKSENILL